MRIYYDKGEFYTSTRVKVDFNYIVDYTFKQTRPGYGDVIINNKDIIYEIYDINKEQFDAFVKKVGVIEPAKVDINIPLVKEMPVKQEEPITAFVKDVKVIIPEEEIIKQEIVEDVKVSTESLEAAGEILATTMAEETKVEPVEKKVEEVKYSSKKRK